MTLTAKESHFPHETRGKTRSKHPENTPKSPGKSSSPALEPHFDIIRFTHFAKSVRECAQNRVKVRTPQSEWRGPRQRLAVVCVVLNAPTTPFAQHWIKSIVCSSFLGEKNAWNATEYCRDSEDFEKLGILWFGLWLYEVFHALSRWGIDFFSCLNASVYRYWICCFW